MAALVTLRAGTLDDVLDLVALGHAVVPPTYGPIDAAYARRMLDEWWTPEVLAASLARNAHVLAELDGQVVAMANFGRLQDSYRDFLTGLPVLGESELYDDICDRLGATNDGQRAGAIELALEGLYLARKISKDTAGGETVYG